jgi:hypothetical protein
MNKLLLLLALIASPVWAQTQTTSKGAAARTDPCSPIGKTARGELVYSMKCENLPATPPPSPPQAENREAAPPAEPETRRGGLFGWSFDRRKPDE